MGFLRVTRAVSGLYPRRAGGAFQGAAAPGGLWDAGTLRVGEALSWGPPRSGTPRGCCIFSGDDFPRGCRAAPWLLRGLSHRLPLLRCFFPEILVLGRALQTENLIVF